MELGINNIRFEESHPKNSRVKADITALIRGKERTIEVKSYNENWSPSFTQRQLELMDYFIILLFKNDTFDISHNFVFIPFLPAVDTTSLD